MDLKVGDKLICHRPVIVITHNFEYKYEVTTINKIYSIISIDNNFRDFTIINDLNLRTSFSFEDIEDCFYTIKKYRKLKLEKISSNNE